MSKSGKLKSSRGKKSSGGFSSRTKSSSRAGSSRRSSSSSRGGRPRRGRAAANKFNPSDFIKKVEETVPSQVYVPKHAFADFQIADQLKENIRTKGYETPTPIQDKTIPLVLEGKDLVATANTGTGKTAAFLIPLVNSVLTKKIDRVLIMAPTRELAAQIQDELNGFKLKTFISSGLCIGGASIVRQIAKLRKKPQFVIGTPGRLKDLVQQNVLKLAPFNAVVLDEVDTMLDMGFIHDIRFLLDKLSPKRQSLFFSATISPAISALMGEFLHQPIAVSAKTRQSAENVNQDVIKVGSKDKVELLHDLLIKPGFDRVIVFVRTKWGTDKLYRKLLERGFKVVAMHGNKTQGQRNKSLASFKDGKAQILLATDVVARGIDIDDVSHVINFDLPATHEDYIHRIGRTGRANKIGQAITFID